MPDLPKPPPSGIGLEYDHQRRILRLDVIADDGTLVPLTLTTNAALTFVKAVLDAMGIESQLTIGVDPSEGPPH